MGPFVGSGPDLFVVRDANDAVVDDPDLAFVSSDETVATVDQAGVLSAIAAGRTLITVTSPNAADPSGLARFRLTVVEQASLGELNLVPTSSLIMVSTGIDIVSTIATVGGENIANPLVFFTSDDPTVAVVDPFSGEVIGLKAGTATITGTVGTLMATTEITVVQ